MMEFALSISVNIYSATFEWEMYSRQIWTDQKVIIKNLLDYLRFAL